MRDTVYIVTTDNRPVQDWLLDRMSGWDRDVYQQVVAEGGLASLVRLDWADCWTQGEDVFDTYEAAKADADERTGVHHVLALTIEDVEEAIRRLVA